MHTIDLNGSWRLKYRVQNEGEWQEITAQVPGNVEIELMREGLLPDLTKGNSIYQTLTFEQHEWLYAKSFRIADDFPEGKTVLVFEGIDCMATVKLNGREVGRAANMFIAHRFDVTDYLERNTDNLLEVHIASAVEAGRAMALAPETHASAHNWESLTVRKAPHMYGWDIAPRIVSAGLWRGVRLEREPETRFRSVYVGTTDADTGTGNATVMLEWDLVTDQSVRSLQLGVSIEQDGQVVHQFKRPLSGTHCRHFIDLHDVKLWWPRGYGDPNLYDLKVSVQNESGDELADYHQKLGIRTVELRRTETTSDQHDGDFSFIVNGQRVFVKGTNWVPLDSLHSLDQSHLQRTFEMAVDLNCNMLRCWGGNVYEDREFFDLCDEHGIMVWQDFALACNCYPQDCEFVLQMQEEAEAVVAKLRNHPSLVLWAGNNEIDGAYAEWSPMKRDPNLCDRISRHVLPDVVSKLDPLRDYLPCSPYYGPELMAAGLKHDMKPEDHLWGPRNDFKGDFYMSSNAHFVSEIGYHGCPDRETMAEMLDADQLWPWQDNDQWLTRAVRPLPESEDYDYRIPLMAQQIEVLFAAPPDNLDDFILASQISQAEAVKFFIEKWRSEKEFRSGILWWNLRDCWPIISDAIVDYYYRKKLAYGYVKACQTDVCAMVTEPENGQHQLVVVNDTLVPVSGEVTVKDADSQEILFSGPFEVEANAKTVVTQLPLAPQATMWLLELDLGHAAPLCNHYVAGPRPFNLDDYRQWLGKMTVDCARF